jgi:leucyl-tRNA synthetase
LIFPFIFKAIKKSAYLMDAAREFRLKLKSASSAGGKKGQSAAPAAKPTHATVYVAKTYPPWQCTVLSVLKQFYESGNGGDNKAISQVRWICVFVSQILAKGVG